MNPALEQSPFFTVVIPLFNKEHFIERAILGVLNQEFQDFELIVIDDGSTDNSAAAVERLISSRARCSLIHQENQGGSGGPARNRGMTLGSGEWFALLDADDLWQPNHLSELKKIISDCPAARLVSTSSTELWEGDERNVDRKQGSRPYYINYFMAASDDDRCVHSSSVAIHHSVPASTGYFGNAKSGQDLEYWARIALAVPVAISPRKTSIYFRGNGGNMEALAAQRKIQATENATPVSCLADVSPSLGMLERRAVSDAALFRRGDIQRYVNARIDQGIRLQIVEENFSKIASLAALKFPAQHKYSFAMTLLAGMPPYALAHIELARKWLKKAMA